MPAFAILAFALVPTWPPAGADARYVWREGASSGPLGRRVDRLCEETFRRALAKEAGHDCIELAFYEEAKAQFGQK